MEDVLERIELTINKIRPYIQRDGGDVELVDFKDPFFKDNTMNF